MATDDDIEREILAKGLTAPRVTPESIEAKIKAEWYFTAMQGAQAALPYAGVEESLARLTICILVLENGFTILGKSAPASAANFDIGLGRKIARADAFNQIWPLEGYLLREQLHQAGGELIGGSVESHAVYKFAGWLTSRDEVLTLSGGHDAAPMAKATAEYLATEGR